MTTIITVRSRFIHTVTMMISAYFIMVAILAALSYTSELPDSFDPYDTPEEFTVSVFLWVAIVFLWIFTGLFMLSPFVMALFNRMQERRFAWYQVGQLVITEYFKIIFMIIGVILFYPVYLSLHPVIGFFVILAFGLTFFYKVFIIVFFLNPAWKTQTPVHVVYFYNISRVIPRKEVN